MGVPYLPPSPEEISAILAGEDLGSSGSPIGDIFAGVAEINAANSWARFRHASSSAYAISQNSGGDTQIACESGNWVRVHDGTAYILNIQNGKVGILQQTPAAMLDIQANATTDIGLGIELAASHTGNAIEVNSNGETDGSVFKVTPTGQVHASGIDATGDVTSKRWQITGTDSDNQQHSILADNIGLIAYDQGSTETLQFRVGTEYPAMILGRGDRQGIQLNQSDNAGIFWAPNGGTVSQSIGLLRDADGELGLYADGTGSTYGQLNANSVATESIQSTSGPTGTNTSPCMIGSGIGTSISSGTIAHIAIGDGATNGVVGSGSAISSGVYIGAASGYYGGGSSNTSNVGIGTRALYRTQGAGSIGIGSATGCMTGSGNYNIDIGGYDSTTPNEGPANRNIRLGFYAGYNGSAASGMDDNIYIGHEAGLNKTDGTNNLIIGSQVNAPTATGSNEISINGALTRSSSGEWDIDGSLTLPASGKLVFDGSVGTIESTSQINISDGSNDYARFRNGGSSNGLDLEQDGRINFANGLGGSLRARIEANSSGELIISTGTLGTEALRFGSDQSATFSGSDGNDLVVLDSGNNGGEKLIDFQRNASTLGNINNSSSRFNLVAQTEFRMTTANGSSPLTLSMQNDSGRFTFNTEGAYGWRFQANGSNALEIGTDGDVDFSGAVLESLVSINNTNSPYTVADGVRTVIADASSGAITINLPAASGQNQRKITIKKTDASNNVTIDANGAEEIDGATTKVLSTQYEIATLVCDASRWHIV